MTIYHGDCREILPTLSVDVDLLLTDPPYGTRVDGDGYGRRQIWHGNQHIAGDEGLSAFSVALASVSAKTLCAFSSPKRSRHVLNLIDALGWTLVAEFIWDKRQAGLGGGIRYQHENIYVASRKEFSGASGCPSVLSESGPARICGEHPHEKPENIVKALALYCGGESLVDPFAGTGTMLVAGKALGRRAIGIEIEERYCEIAAKRLSQEVLPLTATDPAPGSVARGIR